MGTIEWIRHTPWRSRGFCRRAKAAINGELAVCAGSCGQPGNLHLINGLFDCHRNHVPVLAIAAHIPSAEIGSNYFQETHPQELFHECSHYCELVSNPDQIPQILAIAMRYRYFGCCGGGITRWCSVKTRSRRCPWKLVSTTITTDYAESFWNRKTVPELNNAKYHLNVWCRLCSSTWWSGETSTNLKSPCYCMHYVVKSILSGIIHVAWEWRVLSVFIGLSRNGECRYFSTVRYSIPLSRFLSCQS